MKQIGVLLLVFGCSDYEFIAEETGTLLITPDSVVIDGACSYEERELSLESVGEYAVTVHSIEVDGEGWVLLSAPSLPISIEPGTSAQVVVLGNQGDATLLVKSDDPEGGRKVVPLMGAANEDPTIAWVSHANGGIIDPGERLVVSVEDDVDQPSDLVVSWSSDIDGAVGFANGDQDGQSSIFWDEGSGGPHLLTAEVTDSCGASTSSTVEVCRQDGYLSDNLDLSTWAMGGSAQYDSEQGWVELTNIDGTFQAGSAFQTIPTSGNNVQLAFSFYVSGGTGADGFAVTALDTDRSNSYMAQSGGCLGYGGGGVCGDFEPLYGWTIELDTFFSAGLDPTEEDHISFHFDGDVAGYEAYAVLPDMEDGEWHDMVIEVVAPRVIVSVDGETYIDEDIEGYFDFPAEVGFTAATGGETNYHLIDSLSVVEQLCPTEE